MLALLVLLLFFRCTAVSVFPVIVVAALVILLVALVVVASASWPLIAIVIVSVVFAVSLRLFVFGLFCFFAC